MSWPREAARAFHFVIHESSLELCVLRSVAATSALASLCASQPETDAQAPRRAHILAVAEHLSADHATYGALLSSGALQGTLGLLEFRRVMGALSDKYGWDGSSTTWRRGSKWRSRCPGASWPPRQPIGCRWPRPIARACAA